MSTSKKSFTSPIEGYFEKLLKEVDRIDANDWQRFNGKDYQDPHTLMLSMIFLQLTYITAKLAQNDQDIIDAAYCEKGFQLATEEIERGSWVISKFENGLRYPNDGVDLLNEIKSLLQQKQENPLLPKGLIKQVFNYGAKA